MDTSVPQTTCSSRPRGQGDKCQKVYHKALPELTGKKHKHDIIRALNKCCAKECMKWQEVTGSPRNPSAFWEHGIDVVKMKRGQMSNMDKLCLSKIPLAYVCALGRSCHCCFLGLSTTNHQSGVACHVYKRPVEKPTSREWGMGEC